MSVSHLTSQVSVPGRSRGNTVVSHPSIRPFTHELCLISGEPGPEMIRRCPFAHATAFRTFPWGRGGCWAPGASMGEVALNSQAEERSTGPPVQALLNLTPPCSHILEILGRVEAGEANTLFCRNTQYCICLDGISTEETKAGRSWNAKYRQGEKSLKQLQSLLPAPGFAPDA